ncbi:hypothetical protein ACJJI3_10400 [Microbulbifer sp. ZKSA004]|uniref:hypothetical protein n=1 Tax=Microbulbifer sp. ZKSA004 TaxID=3243389 RepID=UPI0040393167
MNREEFLGELNQSIENVYRTEKNHGFLSLGFLREGVGFLAAEYIANSSDVSVLEECPNWVVDYVRSYGNVYEKHGEYKILYPETPGADHTEMAKKLFKLLGSHLNA